MEMRNTMEQADSEEKDQELNFEYHIWKIISRIKCSSRLPIHAFQCQNFG